MNKLFTLFLISLLFLLGCYSANDQKNIINTDQGKLRATYDLKATGQIRFPLDSISAPRIEYTQLISDEEDGEALSFFNKFDRSIYFYDYEDQTLLKKIKIGTNLTASKLIDPTAYYADNADTLYIYNRRNIELLQMNGLGEIGRAISLIGNQNIRQSNWYIKYPQYYAQGSNPMMKVDGKLLFTGQSFESLKDSLLGQFLFLSYTNTRSGKVQFGHLYPDSLYGHNYNWSGEKFTEVYTDWNPDTKKLIFSFPIAHGLYTAGLNADSYQPVFGASNEAGTISSFPASVAGTDISKLTKHILQTDEYGPIRYDRFRKIYYRFLRQAIKDYSPSSQWSDKLLTVVILDKNFTYLGETCLGKLKNWYLHNVFVNEKGLHIEYIPDHLDENYLTYKIFTITKKP